ncbi:hypothetical protein CAPTEDRAFT_217214 [Capitella teleta]|uniref:SAM domain-containing protein n=1 Tax=Capitella teleta TaxID=283909 RepID=R7TVD1_CAPTE|nr:hypothetical protein CAPTEDRAFT_217214 [Capitella teleta]|eukprot:ELT97818.1 hypothetical protein CAPTEDRAFT_217214 [Capitella teleta]
MTLESAIFSFILGLILPQSSWGQMGSGSSKTKSKSLRKKSLSARASTDSGISSSSCSREKAEGTTMPLFKRQSNEAKKRLQHMLYIAKESPESNFDISGCEISEFPSGIFPLCKVLQKESLIAHDNWLTSLKGGGHLRDLCYLKVLDIHDNEMSHLPDDIGCLSALQVLHLQNNKLKSLPSGVGELRNLQILNLKGNKLKNIPSSLSALQRLHTLDISQNYVTELPNELCNIRTLETLNLDAEQMTHPPAEVCSEGTASIMRYLSHEMGVDYKPPSHFLADAMATEDKTDAAKRKLKADMNAVNDTVMQYENLKAKRNEEKKLLEQQLADDQRLQGELAKLSATKKKDVLNTLTKDQERIQDELNSLQLVKQEEHRRRLRSLNEAEENAMHLVSKLIEVNEKANRTEELLDQLEQERIHTEQWFVVRQEEMNNIRTQEVLNAMECILAENKTMSQLLDDFRQKKAQIIEKAREGFHFNTSSQTQEDLQKEAFEVLQIQKDARHKRIAGQIDLIEQELAQLTALEISHRQLTHDLQKDLLEDKRKELTQMLITLLRQRDERQEELRKRMGEMEEQRLDDQMDYWIVQYQRLMDRKPPSLVCHETMLEFAVVEILERASASDYISAFARHRITIETLLALTDDDLRMMGIKELGVRKAILLEAEKYKLLKDEETAANKLKMLETDVDPNEKGGVPGASEGAEAAPPRKTPTAPLPVSEVIARGINSECVICMENVSNLASENPE